MIAERRAPTPASVSLWNASVLWNSFGGPGYYLIPERVLPSDWASQPALLLELESALDTSQTELLALMRTKGLSIEGPDSEKKEQLRTFLDYLHNTKGMSLNDVAKLVGNKTSGYTSWLCRQLGVQRRPFEEARLKGIREKRRKYERKPFDGTDEDRAYLLGLRHGDYSASRPFNGAIRVSISTTHPAMSRLFRSLFEPYGHVYENPRFKKDTQTYEWSLYAILDNSFEFLLSPFPKDADWLLSRPSITRAYLAGLFDAEGSVGIYPDKGHTSLNVIYYNTNLQLMWFVHDAIARLGFRPLEPYLDKPKGFRSPGYHIEMKKDYWRVLLARFEECQEFLQSIPLRHEEKVAKRGFACAISFRELWTQVGLKVESTRSSIKSGRDASVAEAERSYLSKSHRRCSLTHGANTARLE